MWRPSGETEPPLPPAERNPRGQQRLREKPRPLCPPGSEEVAPSARVIPKKASQHRRFI